MQAALIKNEQTDTLKLHVAKRRSTITKMAEGWQKAIAQAYEKLKAQVRSRVEHPFHVIKNLFHYKKRVLNAGAHLRLQLLVGLRDGLLPTLAILVIALRRLATCSFNVHVCSFLRSAACMSSRLSTPT